MKNSGIDRDRAFDGETYSPQEDFERLKTSLERVRFLMTNPAGSWWTLSELAERTGSSEAGISARIRDLRKEKNGSHAVESVRHRDGLWRYRVAGPPVQINLFDPRRSGGLSYAARKTNRRS
tara:strand:+ start:659 stop:1024 length:366 start_codon:yes stop_codon:yes gene_type:complete